MKANTVDVDRHVNEMRGKFVLMCSIQRRQSMLRPPIMGVDRETMRNENFIGFALPMDGRVRIGINCPWTHYG